jgi:hypothetical protein
MSTDALTLLAVQVNLYVPTIRVVYRLSGNVMVAKIALMGLTKKAVRPR